ncbi:hypothetical protein O77CONTIG1_03295 [Leptolyngbya sp. O-77]|nr:hypothetical protein O77CONTIG1_03295 [Leptolyngbya sp. O-77]
MHPQACLLIGLLKRFQVLLIFYEGTASNPSIIRAFGDAYVQAINQILSTVS